MRFGTWLSRASCVILVAMGFIGAPLAAQTLVATPPSVTFSYVAGQPGGVTPQAITITASSGTISGLSATLSQPPNAPTLFQIQQSVNTINVGVNTSLLGPPAPLASGDYSGSINVTATGFPALTIPLTFRMGSAVVIAVTPTALSFNVASNTAPPQAQSLSLTSSGLAVSYSVTVSTQSGGNWLTVSPTSGTTTSGTLSVAANPTGLPTGTYAGNVRITGGSSTLNVPITMVVGTSGTLSVSPTALPFTFITGGTAPPAQFVFVSSSVATSYTATATSTGSWLLINNTTSTSGTLPASISVTVSASTLTPGTYTGTITITAFDGSTQAVQVTLVVSGTSAIAVSPPSLTFSSTVGTSPSQQTVSVGTGTANVTFTASTSSTSGWLTVSPTSGTLTSNTVLTISANASGLAAGTYSGFITIATTGGLVTTQTIPVNLTISGASGGVIVVSPSALSFGFQFGTAFLPPPQTLVLPGSSGTFTATKDSNATWLNLSTTSGVTPGSLSVSANPSGLSVGTYTGTITISSPSGVQAVTVTLLVSAGAVLIPNPGSLQVNVQSGSGGGVQNIIVTSSATPNTELSYTVVPSVSWITVSPTSGTTPVTGIGVAVNPTGLAAGTYSGNIAISSIGAANNPLNLPVTVTIGTASGGALTLSPTSMSFAASAGGSATPQPLQVSSAVPASFTASAASTGNWLSVTPTTAATPASLSVSVIPGSLTAGTYNGTISVSGGGTTQQVQVTLTITGAAGAIGVNPTTLAFTHQQGAAAPVPQAVQVATSGSSNPVSFTASASSSGGWLAVSPTSSSTPATLSASVNPGSLNPGTYSGTITVTPTGGTAQTVNVTLTVQAAAAVTVNSNSLAFAFRLGESTPAPQTISVGSTGAALPFTVSDNAAWLDVSPTSGTTPATLNVSVNPANLAPGTQTGTITVTGNGTPASSQTISVVLNVQGQLMTINSVVNSASYRSGSISQGEIVVLFGTNFGPAQLVGLQLDAQGRVATTLAGVQVLFNGLPAPLIYASATQTAAVVPYEVTPRADATVQVVYQGVRSNGLSVPVAVSAPGIFTQTQTGSGAGAIINQDGTVNSAANAAAKGSVIAIYATGEGQTIPSGISGKINNDGTLPRPVLPTSVTIDGQPAEVTYAGGAPDLVSGALQVNARVPAGAASGTVAVVVTVGTNSSQAGVTLSVQ